MVFLLILIIGTACGYDFKCPIRAVWRLRANVLCHLEDKYVCLFHILENRYEDNCLGSDQSSIGSKLVFQPLFNLAECNTERYQPIVFTTHGNSECILRKSKCVEEGQVVFSNGSSGSDIACRCDYSKGYAFVSKPKNSCYCIPSEEDCSCIRLTCATISPDYKCITNGNILLNATCPEIPPHISYNTHTKTVQFIESNKKSYKNAHKVAFIIIASIVVYIAFVVIALLKVNVFVPPTILSQEIIETDGRNIGLKYYVRSYLPLTCVKWCKEPGEIICADTNSNNVFSRKGIRILTFETLEEYDIALYKCIASNIIGTVESVPKQLNEDRRQNIIHELFQKGACGKLHFARLVFIGKNGVGKTSLMRRLLWQKKDDVISTESTDGIEVEKCNINIADGKWSPCDKTDDDLARLIHQVYNVNNLNVETTAVDNDVDQVPFGSNTDESRSVPNRELHEKHISTNVDESEETIYSRSSEHDNAVEMDIRREHNNSFRSENIDNNGTGSTEFIQLQTENIEFQNVNDNEININNYEININDHEVNINDNDSDPANDENINKLTATIMKSYLQLTDKEHNDMMAFCWLWDFAGQKDFYATHQVFLSSCAVYLLVTDSLDFNKAENQGINFEDSAQYVKFWFDAIHCYWSTTKKGRLHPPIIVVCTNEDRFKEPLEQQRRREKFQENLNKILKKQKKKKHLRNVYFVSNTEDDDTVFEEIRKSISREAMDMTDWGRDCPLKWVLFQQVLGKLKESGVPISTTTKLSKIAKHDDIGISNDEEFKLCLQYCHDNGTVIYFEEENLQDHVILDPKWLVDAFRCLVSDKIEHVIKVSDHWQNLTETGELTDKLISSLFRKEPQLKFLENKSHILEVLKRFDIIVNLNNSNTLYMPCMMKSCSFEEVRKQFFDSSHSFYRTSWYCLEFQFLPPAFFNHILAWYIKQYSVSVILEKGPINERKALYRQIGVFDLNSSGCEQLVVCEGPNVIALQVWDSRMFEKEYGDVRKQLFEFVGTLRNRYRLKIKFTETFKCHHGDFTINRRDLNELVEKDFRCLEHKTNHKSDDLVKPWGFSGTLNLIRAFSALPLTDEALAMKAKRALNEESDEDI